MDYSKLKGRPPYPFETIGVALAFSPWLEGVLAEARRLAADCGARLLLLHVGERTAAKEQQLREIATRLGLDLATTPMLWTTGETVATLLKLCKDNSVDLLILGARRRENRLRYYLGSVAHQLSRAAKCSLLLLTEPTVATTSFQRLVISGVSNPKTVHTLDTALYFAEQVGSDDLTVVTEIDQPGLAMAMAEDSTASEVSRTKRRISSAETDKVQALLKQCHPGVLEVAEKIIHGRPGYAIRQYAESSQADLLVINSPDGRYGLIDRIFTHGMEYILEELPCNMLIVHSRGV